MEPLTRSVVSSRITSYFNFFKKGLHTREITTPLHKIPMREIMQHYYDILSEHEDFKKAETTCIEDMRTIADDMQNYRDRMLRKKEEELKNSRLTDEERKHKERHISEMRKENEEQRNFMQKRIESKRDYPIKWVDFGPSMPIFDTQNVMHRVLIERAILREQERRGKTGALTLEALKHIKTMFNEITTTTVGHRGEISSGVFGPKSEKAFQDLRNKLGKHEADDTLRRILEHIEKDVVDSYHLYNEIDNRPVGRHGDIDIEAYAKIMGALTKTRFHQIRNSVAGMQKILSKEKAQ